MLASPHRAPLAGLGLDTGEVESLARYLDLLAAWSARVNLTAARGPEERVARLVADVLPARQLPAPGRLIDVGSGNGSPGLVLAILRPDLQVTLLEPRTRRWAFLREAARDVGRPVDVLRLRHDRYEGGAAPTATLRGLDLPLADLAPLVGPEGRLIVFGTRSRPPEPPFEEVPKEGIPKQLQVFRRRRVSRET